MPSVGSMAEYSHDALAPMVLFGASPPWVTLAAGMNSSRSRQRLLPVSLAWGVQ